MKSPGQEQVTIRMMESTYSNLLLGKVGELGLKLEIIPNSGY